MESSGTEARLARANKIFDRIEPLLLDAFRYVGLSKTGASSKAEAMHAIYLVTAQVYARVHLYGDSTAEMRGHFDEFAKGTGQALFMVTHYVLPDAETKFVETFQSAHEQARRSPVPDDRGDPVAHERFAKMSKLLDEFRAEEARLRALIGASDAVKAESMESFVRFLRTLRPSSADYWRRVFDRIGVTG
jgi:hypothetical protein